MEFLLDTNIILLHVREGFFNIAPADTQFIISVISEAEVLRYSGLSENDLRELEIVLATLRVINVDSTIARRAATLGRIRTTKLPDLLIAATALELNIPLITKNLHDFKDIPGLEVRDTM
ncbi:MAG: type II toxin-antitoxin system VapC family toxin [bacterium]|nr:type II toxin-antitoxin system VapC family toxin [bacterium]